MLKLPVPTRILNAAAVFSGRHGAVSRPAEPSECRRETGYEHARKAEQRRAPAPGALAERAELGAETRRLRPQSAHRERAAEDRVLIDQDHQRRRAPTAFAMGLSPRRSAALLGRLLPAPKAPDPSTVGPWVRAEAARAGGILAALDSACAPRVRTRALDETFFGGDRPRSGSSRPV